MISANMAVVSVGLEPSLLDMMDAVASSDTKLLWLGFGGAGVARGREATGQRQGIASQGAGGAGQGDGAAGRRAGCANQGEAQSAR